MASVCWFVPTHLTHFAVQQNVSLVQGNDKPQRLFGPSDPQKPLKPAEAKCPDARGSWREKSQKKIFGVMVFVCWGGFDNVTGLAGKVFL